MSFDFADLIVPQPIVDIWNLRVSQKSAFIASGLVTIDDSAANGGHFAAKRLRDEDTAAALKIDGSTSHPASVLGAVRDYAPVLRRVRPRVIPDGMLAAEGRLSGSTPDAGVLEQSANYWAREADDALLSVISALFDEDDGCLFDTHCKTLATDSPSTPVTMSYSAVLDALALAGDSVQEYAALALHSKQWKDLQAEAGAKISAMPITGSPVPAMYCANLRIIVTDALPVVGSGSNAVYTAVAFRPGALWIATQQPIKEWIAPDPSLPALRISESWHFAASVEGVKWSSTDINPENAGLATATNWAKTAPTPTARTDKRTLGLVAVRTN